MQIEDTALRAKGSQLLAALLLHHRPQRSFLNTVNATIKVWESTIKRTKGLPHEALSHIPISALEFICPNLTLSTWLSAGLCKIGDLYKEKTLQSFQELLTKFSIWQQDFYKYLQVRHALQEIRWSESNQIAGILQFYEQPNPSHKRISHLYKLLNSPPTMQKLPGMYKWERAFNFSASSKTWQHAACATLRFSRCLSHWETTQKLLHFWYYTPEKLCKMFPSSPSTCWRACGNPGSSAHIWWTCPAISGFWKDVQTLLGVISNHWSNL